MKAKRVPSEGDLATALASSIHELKTPLSIISGFAELLERRWDQADPGELEEMVAVVRRNAARLVHLVEELLLVARLDADMVKIDLTDTNVLPVLQAASQVATARGVGVDVRCPTDLRLRTDPDRLEEMLDTLVENSCRYGKPPVVITAGDSATGIFVSVTDGGAGVAPDDVGALFDPFSRLSSGRNGSNGLGLHTARRIARRLHGNLEYQANDGGGSFVLTIPDESDGDGAVERRAGVAP